ncbi:MULTISPECIES: LytTR family DNA-binding domain-containing protein [unclassified Arenibacter]|uniref:LytR/AlgR family response regulator transcription factor n=1 Tax=unclassified Arenibacter TaxID=2615047 RepID=UPI000E34B746|nr:MULTISPECIES: LytTR family DNA-binding domain-containing protein [unclassified Arenibacter]MCM4163059.1 DNA-binding response regulator [Arenibacter sp. A80]RFT57553.1 DNA-binding response regulator [Arenibacter sp. P308M17]
MKLKCILIDDSTVQRRAVAKIIKEHSKLDLINEYDNGLDAKNGLVGNTVDLIFLDIEMPGFNGFEFLDSMEYKPQVILVSGSPNYAMKAFDYDVTDYLQKPLDKRRFDVSIRKAINKFEIQNSEKVELEYIYVNSNLKKTKLFLNEILWVEAYGDYVKVVSYEKKTLILSTMKAFAKQLPKDKFLRIHKSFTVNLEKIENFNGSTVEINEQTIPLSRHKKEALIQALVIIE